MYRVTYNIKGPVTASDAINKAVELTKALDLGLAEAATWEFFSPERAPSTLIVQAIYRWRPDFDTLPQGTVAVAEDLRSVGDRAVYLCPNADLRTFDFPRVKLNAGVN